MNIKSTIKSLFVVIVCFNFGINVAQATKPQTPTTEQAQSQAQTQGSQAQSQIRTPLQAQTQSQSQEQVILIQSAASGKIEQDKTQKNQYTITLNKVLPYLSYVAERPNRTMGQISLERYLSLWQATGKDSFQSSTPNAILYANSRVDQPEKSHHYVALEIFKPTYDSKTETLVYQARALAGMGADVPNNASFKNVTLIIDDVCLGCWGR